MAIIGPPPGFKGGPRVARKTTPSSLVTIKKSAKRSIHSFRNRGCIGHRGFGTVFLAKDVATGEVVAIKKVRADESSHVEIECLSAISHPSIIGLKEVVEDSSGRDDDDDDGSVYIYIVMEYAPHDLRSLLKTMLEPFDESYARDLMSQLLRGVLYLHRSGILHRDIKTANVLMSSSGALKICDLGLCLMGYDGRPGDYSGQVGTLRYRAPELLLGVTGYSAAIDMWAVGCVMGDLVGKEALFRSGECRMDQMAKIVEVLGEPDDRQLAGIAGEVTDHESGPEWRRSSSSIEGLKELFSQRAVSISVAALHLLSLLLEYNPQDRMTAEVALEHPWFSCCCSSDDILDH